MKTKTAMNVVNLKASFTMKLTEITTYEGRKKIAARLRGWERLAKENTFYRFGRDVGLSPTTVARFASEDTKEPRTTTTMLIMHGLGFNAVTFHNID